MAQSVNKSPIVRWGKKLRPAIDRVVTRYSDDPTDPVLDSRNFTWTKVLRDATPAIRAEAAAVLSSLDTIPSLAAISPDHAKIAPMDQWRSFFLYGYGNAIPENLIRCPSTAAALRQVPHLNSAFFRSSSPGRISRRTAG